MVYEAGLVAAKVTNRSGEHVSKANKFFPVDTEKTIVCAKSQVASLRARRGLEVEVLFDNPTKEEIDGLEVDRPFSFNEMDQSLKNATPGDPGTRDAPKSPEQAALPAVKFGRQPELRLEQGVADKVAELGLDLAAISGTGEDGQITIRDVVTAYEVGAGAEVFEGTQDPGEIADPPWVPEWTTEDEELEGQTEGDTSGENQGVWVNEPNPDAPSEAQGTEAGQSGAEESQEGGTVVVTPDEPTPIETVPADHQPTEGVKATKEAAQLANELGVDLNDVEPTGKTGSVLVDDVRRYAEEQG